MNIIHLNNRNIDIWIQQIQEYIKKIAISDIESLYQNINYPLQRLSAGVEQSFIAEENGKVIGMIAAFGNAKKNIWNLVLLHVVEEKRLNLIGTNLFHALEQELSATRHQFRVAAQCKVSDQYTNIFYLSKGFRFEGWCRAVDEKDDMYVWAKLYSNIPN